MKSIYSVWSNSSTVYTKDALEKFIASFKEAVITFHTYDFQLDMLKDLVVSRKVATLYITHEDRTEEVYNG